MWRGFPTGWLQGQVLNGSRSTRVCRQLGLQAWAACRRRTDVAQTGAGSEDTFLSLLSLTPPPLLSSPLLSSSPSLPLIHDPCTSRSAPCLLEPRPAFLSLQSPEESVLPVPWRAVLASLICFSTGFPSTPRGVARGPSRLPTPHPSSSPSLLSHPLISSSYPPVSHSSIDSAHNVACHHLSLRSWNAIHDLAPSCMSQVTGTVGRSHEGRKSHGGHSESMQLSGEW